MTHWQRGTLMDEQRSDFYQTLRKGIREWLAREGTTSKWAEYVLLVPDLFHLVCK
jgi:hypothetical protein